MRFNASFGSTLGTVAFSLTACSGNGSQFAPGANQGIFAQSRAANSSTLRIVDRASVKAQVDVAQYGSGASAPGQVNEYTANNKKNVGPFCQIEGLIQVIGIETDESGNLWVPQLATASGPGEIIEYAPDCGAPIATLSVPSGWAIDIAFAKNGTIYVSNDLGPVGTGPGSILVYPAGATSPDGELTNPAVAASQGVAVDSKGNVFQSYGGNPGGVLEFKGGGGSGTILTGIDIPQPGFVFIDKHNDLIVIDDGTKLDTFAPPYAALASSFRLKGVSSQCAIDKAEKNVACADYQNDTVDVYAYPSGTYQYSFNSGLRQQAAYTFGVAQDPR